MFYFIQAASTPPPSPLLPLCLRDILPLYHSLPCLSVPSSQIRRQTDNLPTSRDSHCYKLSLAAAAHLAYNVHIWWAHSLADKNTQRKKERRKKEERKKERKKEERNWVLCKILGDSLNIYAGHVALSVVTVFQSLKLRGLLKCLKLNGGPPSVG